MTVNIISCLFQSVVNGWRMATRPLGCFSCEGVFPRNCAPFCAHRRSKTIALGGSHGGMRIVCSGVEMPYQMVADFCRPEKPVSRLSFASVERLSRKSSLAPKMPGAEWSRGAKCHERVQQVESTCMNLRIRKGHSQSLAHRLRISSSFGNLN